MRIAVAGSGVIGRHHGQTVEDLQDAQLACFVDPVLEKAQLLGNKYGVPAYTSLAEALGAGDVDAVAVCVPSGLHTELAVQALEAGKHVVIEKPLDVTPEAVKKIVDAEKASDRTATVISQHRFDQASQITHQAVQEGRFGKLTSGSVSIAWWRSQGYYDSGEWRGTWALDGGGALMNQGVHSLDLLVWFLGQPVEVFATAHALAHERIEVEDTIVATITFENGAIASLHGTTAAYPGLTARIQVHGDRGSAVIDGDRLSYYHAADPDAEGNAYGAGGKGNQADQLVSGTAGPTAGADPSALSDSHSLQYRDFLDAIRDGRQPLVTVTEGARSVDAIFAIYESARIGKPVAVAPRHG